MIGRDYIAVVAEGHTPSVTNGLVDITPSFVVPVSALQGNAVFIAPAVGVNFNFPITFGGTYAVGDQIVVTVCSNDRSAQKWKKIYRHTVPSGGTALADIAAYFATKIQTDGLADAPYTAASAAAVTTVTAKNDDSKGIEGSGSTDSSAGTIVVGPAVGTISEGQPQDLIDKGIDPNDINLASYDTVRFDYSPEVPIGSVDAKTKRAREVYWYGTPGEGNAFATLINGL